MNRNTSIAIGFIIGLVVGNYIAFVAGRYGLSWPVSWLLAIVATVMAVWSFVKMVDHCK